MTEDTQTETKQPKKRTKEEWFKIFGVSLAIIGILILIGFKISNPDMETKNLWIIGSMITILGIIAFFGNKFNNLLKKLKKQTDEELPNIIGEDEILEILYKEAHKKWNNIKIEKGIEAIGSSSINKNIIYAYKLNMNLDDESMIVILNATYPQIQPSILPSDASLYTIQKEMNKKALNPHSEPDTIESVTKMDEFGRPIQKTKEVKHKRKKKKKEEEDEVI